MAVLAIACAPSLARSPPERAAREAPRVHARVPVSTHSEPRPLLGKTSLDERLPGEALPAPVLPEGMTPGVFVSIDLSPDAPILVSWGEATATRVLVYLHGACGDVAAPRAWLRVAARYGTLIALRGERPCGEGDRYYWSPDTSALDARIQRAVGRVARERGALLDPNSVVLIGYSQGAARVQELVYADPERYRWVVLAGIPMAPSPKLLKSARAVAVLGGERELLTHMRSGVWALRVADIPVRFDTFPKARHGEFGPDAERVMDEALDWVVSE